MFHFPDREKVYLGWGDLEKAKKKYPTPEKQADQDIKTMSKNEGVKDFQRVSNDMIEISSHKAAYNRVKFNETLKGLFVKKTVRPREGYSFHLYCEDSSRYFVLYTLLSSNAPEDFGDLFRIMMNSFRCH